MLTTPINPSLDKCIGAATCAGCPSCKACLRPHHKIGRPPLKATVQNVLNAVRAHSTLTAAAKELGVSRISIHRVLKAHGLSAEGVRQNKK